MGGAATTLLALCCAEGAATDGSVQGTPEASGGAVVAMPAMESPFGVPPLLALTFAGGTAPYPGAARGEVGGSAAGSDCRGQPKRLRRT